MTLTILHNPRCSKSCQTLALIEDAGITPNVVKYLDNPPTKAELKTILEKLGFETPQELMRKGEAIYKELGLKEKTLSDNDYKNYILEHYTFLKRPVILCNGQIFIGNSKKVVEAAKNIIHAES